MEIETVRKIFIKLDAVSGLFILKSAENEQKTRKLPQILYRILCGTSIFFYIILLSYKTFVSRYSTLEFFALLTDLITYFIMIFVAMKFYLNRIEINRILDWCFAQYNLENFHSSVKINASIRFGYAQRVLVKYVKVLTAACTIDWILLFIMYPIVNYQETKYDHMTPLDLDIPFIGSRREKWSAYLIDYYLQASGDHWFLMCFSMFFGIFIMVYFTVTAYMDTIVWIIIKIKRELESESSREKNDDQNEIKFQPKRMAWVSTKAKVKLVAMTMQKRNRSNVSQPMPGTSRESESQEVTNQKKRPHIKTLDEWLSIVVDMFCDVIEIYSAYTTQLKIIILLFEITVFLSNFVLGLTVLLARDDTFMFIDLMFLNIILVMIAYANDMVQEKSFNISNAFYGLPWHIMTTEDRKSTSMVLNIVNFRIGMSSGGIHFLTRKRFCWIVFISYGFCLILRTVILYRNKKGLV